jgi:Arc/MetJ-type ribon-helix-helix transcriptional regulator
METLQIRLTKNMLDRIDVLIQQGTYPNRSEAVRDSVRKMLDRKSVMSDALTVSVKDLQKFIKTAGRQ